MLGFDPRAARYTWTAASVLLLVILVYLVRRTLFVFVVALLFAYLLSPLVDRLDRFFPGTRTRTPALALAYLILIGFLGGGGALVGSRIADEANALAKQFPELVARWERFGTPASPNDQSLRAQILQKVKEQVGERANELLESLPRASLRFLSVAGDVVYVVVVPILGFFFLKDSREIREYCLGLVDSRERRAMLDDLFADVHLLLAHYMRAVFTLCVCTMICYSIALSIMGLQYGILLGAVAGILEFIPMIGPLCGMVICLVVGAVGGAPILVMIGFLLIYRLFLDYVLSPYIMGAGVELHPLAVLFGVFAGAEVAGIAGAFLSVPVLALVRVLYGWIRKVRSTRLSPTATPVS